MASNANVNKVVYGANVLIDLTEDTVAADKLLSGITAHDKSGAQITGTYSGGGSNEYAPNDVNFFDYNGTIVYSCSAADFANLQAMPANPSHTDIGLTAQGWNWSLANAKTYVAAYGILDIGQMYVPTDGKTHIYITLDEDFPAGRRVFNLRFQASVNQGVEIDWGDGSAITVSQGTSVNTYSHTYAANGDYDVKINVVTGTLTFPGTDGNDGYSLYGWRSTGSGRLQFRAAQMITRVSFGTGISTIGGYAFYGAHHLRSVTIPRGVTTMGAYMFYNCYQLDYCTLPDTITDTVGHMFQNCLRMRYVSLPRSLTATHDYDFYNCYCLARLAVPDSVTTVGNFLVYNDYSIKKVILPDSITSLGSSTVGMCYALEELRFPANITELKTRVLYNCYGLRHVVIPNGVTTIGNSFALYLYSTAKITIPASVTSIGDTAFQCPYGVTEFHFLPTTPPTLGTNAFQSYRTDCVMYVPYSADHSILNAYKTATNWSTYASLMVEEPQ